MHLHFEKPHSELRCDAVVNSMSWMGRVPDEQPEGHGWKLNRTSYYQEGWLATGNLKGVVGVTFSTTLGQRSTSSSAASTSSSAAIMPLPPRTNYNLRGHRAQISLVRWNEPYQKLATCDSSGIIFVWIRYEGRWSIELINDRNMPVTHFSWSHDGRMAVIAYQDGFVLVGSVAGQRYWSTILSQESTITAGSWTPDDQQVYLGTSNGSIVVLDVHNGSVLSQVTFAADSSIRELAWNCPRFKMEEPAIQPESGTPQPGTDEQHILAVMTCQGKLSLIKSFDDLNPSVINTELQSPMIEWNNGGEFICVAGYAGARQANGDYHNYLHFYTDRGVLRYRILVPYTRAPITSVTWGHNDRRLFVATGNVIHVAWVSRRIPSLQHLSRLRLRNSLRDSSLLYRIEMPRPLRNLVLPLFASTVHQGHVPEESKIRDFVCQPPPANTRLYCTMIRRDDDSGAGQSGGGGGVSGNGVDSNGSGGNCNNTNGATDIDPPDILNGYVPNYGVAFTLYLEFLGGLIPLLKGKPTSKLRPEFVIFDPQQPSGAEELARNAELRPEPPKPERRTLFSPALGRKFGRSRHPPPAGANSDSETDDSCVSTPRLQRKFRKSSSAVKPSQHREDGTGSANFNGSADLKTSLPEQFPLAQVTSNIWGTKFKILGLAPNLPAHLGQVTYKTSLLHLQPRQMTLGVVDLREPYALHDDVDPHSTPSDEDDDGTVHQHHHKADYTAPVAPLTPNLRLRRPEQPCSGANAVEPPPSPTHQIHRPLQRHELETRSRFEEFLCIEWNGQSERIVLSPAVRWRSLSTGHLDCALMRFSSSAERTRSKDSPFGRHPSQQRNPTRRKSRSLDSSPVPYDRPRLGVRRSWAVQVRQMKNDKNSLTKRITNEVTQGGTREKRFALARLSPLFGRKLLGGGQTGAEPKRGKTQSPRGASEPNTPNASPQLGRRHNPPKKDRHNSPIRQLLNSPLLARRLRRGRLTESSDEDLSMSGDEVNGFNRRGSKAPTTDPFLAHNYQDLESFQKAQLLNKLRQTLLAEKNSPNGGRNGAASVAHLPPPVPVAPQRLRPRRREFVLHNKAPLWNEHSQVYQLDFGGRVTQESAKNFQIEFKGKQVMQFGRIDGNAYTLDFQYPFSAVQAFAVALANVTQRLK